MRIHGVTVCRNEANRFLESSLAHAARWVDELFVYDDQSTDGSAELASSFAEVVVRPDDIPTFLDDEGTFRQASWDAWERTCHPEYGDFVLAFDLDEFYIGKDLREVVADWHVEWTGGVIVRPEVWDLENRLVRTDGYWDEIANIRFFPYQKGGIFRHQTLAGGSHPLYAEGRTPVIPGHLLHLGYSDPADREERWQRYHCRGGHNPRHIDSILHEAPVLEEYQGEYGPLPDIRRGAW